MDMRAAALGCALLVCMATGISAFADPLSQDADSARVERADDADSEFLTEHAMARARELRVAGNHEQALLQQKLPFVSDFSGIL
ncbi:MAG: hypothetical protein ABWU13_16570 [Limnospira maxima]